MDLTDQMLMYFQKLYTVCDVAMNIIMSKSTTYSLESPKDPVLPSRFFTKPDKVRIYNPSIMQKNLLLDSFVTFSKALLTGLCFFLQNVSNTKNYLPPEMKAFFTPGKVSLIKLKNVCGSSPVKLKSILNSSPFVALAQVC